MNNNIEQSWKHNWFGIWNDDGRDQDFPDVESAVSMEWCPYDKTKLREYLERCPMVMSCPSGKTCKLCSIPISSCFQSDGEWLWEQSLSHYLEQHFVILPLRMVQHIRTREYSAPTSVEVPTAELPWPSGFVFSRQQEFQVFPVKRAPMPRVD